LYQELKGCTAGKSQGVWGPKAIHLTGSASTTLSCLRTKIPKSTKKSKIKQKERNTMNKTQNKTKQLKKQKAPITLKIITTMALLNIITACASNATKDESFENLLRKESTLIEKVKLERAQAEVATAVDQNVILKTSEGHLLESLNALLKANEIMQMRFQKQTQREVEHEHIRFNKQ
jgi:hypothetical protein